MGIPPSRRSALGDPTAEDAKIYVGSVNGGARLRGAGKTLVAGEMRLGVGKRSAHGSGVGRGRSCGDSAFVCVETAKTGHSWESRSCSPWCTVCAGVVTA